MPRCRPPTRSRSDPHLMKEAISTHSERHSACNQGDRGATLTIEGLMKEAISMQSRSDPHHRGPDERGNQHAIAERPSPSRARVANACAALA